MVPHLTPEELDALVSNIIDQDVPEAEPVWKAMHRI